MKINKFEDIIAWQKSQEIAFSIYKEFSNLKDFGFKDQICRAAISISNNIAEGFDRSSNKEFVRFLFISAGSCSELRSMLYLANKLEYINEEKKLNLIDKSEEISKIIKGLIKSLDRTVKK